LLVLFYMVNEVRFVGEVCKTCQGHMDIKTRNALLEASLFLAKELDFDMANVNQAITKMPHEIFITRDDITGKIIGVAALEKDPKEEMNWLTYLAIEQEYRGLKIGKFVMEGVKQLSGNKAIGLSFVPSKTRTKFYESCGFRIMKPPHGQHKAIYRPR